MNQRITLLTGAIVAAFCVLSGALGAHALKATLEASGRTKTYELAVQYGFYHAIALLITGILMIHFTSRKLNYAALCFALGILCFSGSLYVLSFASIKMIGPITPLGGLFFITGWVMLALGLRK